MNPTLFLRMFLFHTKAPIIVYQDSLCLPLRFVLRSKFWRLPFFPLLSFRFGMKSTNPSNVQRKKKCIRYKQKKTKLVKSGQGFGNRVCPKYRGFTLSREGEGREHSSAWSTIFLQNFSHNVSSESFDILRYFPANNSSFVNTTFMQNVASLEVLWSTLNSKSCRITKLLLNNSLSAHA